MPERYKNVDFGSLDEYITPRKFRTVSEDMRSIPMGANEYAVEIRLKKKAKSKLSFKTPWDGTLYGCATGKREMKQKLGLTSEIKTAYIVDWDDKFLLMLELENSEEKPVSFVSSGDVLNLLEKCRRIPEQKSDTSNTRKD